MDNDNFFPLKFRGAQILGLKKLAVSAIETEGIVLQELEAEKGKNSIVWKAAGQIMEYIAGRLLGEDHVLELHSQGGEENHASRLVLRSSPKNGSITAFVGGPGIEQRTIVDNTGASSFFQLAPPMLGRINYYGVVSALPAEPFIGDICIFEASEKVGWLLVYTGVGTFKWKKIGGPPLVAEVAKEETTKSNVYADLETIGPAITAPLKGDYLVGIGCAAFNSEAGRDNSMSYAIGGTGAIDEDRLKFTNTGVFLPQGNIFRRKEKTNLAIAASIKAKYKTSGGTASFNSRFIELDPIRVG